MAFHPYRYSCSKQYSSTYITYLGSYIGAIALSYPPRVRVRATVKLSAAFFNDESSITIGGYESAISSHKYSTYANVPENLTFLPPDTNRCMYRGRTRGWGLRNVIFQEILCTYYKGSLFVKIIFTLGI